MDQNIREQLVSLAEPDFQRFTQKLLPGVEGILGVRLPTLRKIAKKIARGDWQDYLQNASDDTYEEVMLQGMVIGYLNQPLVETLQHVDRFLPKISNWSVCDSFCSGLKIPHRFPQEVWAYLVPLLSDHREYYVRFALVMLLFYYVEQPYLEHLFPLFDSVRHDGYYAKMALAWAVSICYIRYPDQTYLYLRSNNLDDFTRRKALQKITESHCVEEREKQKIRALRKEL